MTIKELHKCFSSSKNSIQNVSNLLSDKKIFLDQMSCQMSEKKITTNNAGFIKFDKHRHKIENKHVLLPYQKFKHGQI